ncbi:MAG: hypothetical protein AseanaTS_05830 [Candidatus Pelagadaptatus aseana]|uniref:hypothetical protein n=1 Tax=Candidatus Pelagadaptatus aseana TaxID=3120508 RepID=UPI0039B169A7
MTDTPDSKWETETPTEDHHPWWQRHQKELLLFTILVLVLLIIALWLPNKISAPLPAADSESSNASAASSSTAPASPATTTGLESPWQDAQTTKARRQAQEILAKLMDRQAKLEKMSVQLWADQAFASAQSHAEQADQLYRQRQFIEAQQHYQQALTSFDDILAAADSHFQQALAMGQQTLAEHQPKQALEAMTLASAIQPDNPDAQQGLQRAQNLPEVMSLLAQSRSLQQTLQLDEALTAIEQARELDNKDPKVQQQHSDITEAINQRDFKLAMGRGYNALHNKQYGDATKAFLLAQRLQPESSAPKSGLQQVADQKQQLNLNRYFNRAQQLENKERWQEAKDNYDLALKTDQSLIQAKVGSLRTGARATLHQQLQQLIDAPLRLSNDSVYQQAQTTLKDARAIRNPGPILQAQINTLQQIIATARQPVSVTLHSDNATEVTVYKVGKLGQFAEQQLQLIPGKYVAVGSRLGYRDVRQEFVITPDGLAAAVTIQCTEKIALDS